MAGQLDILALEPFYGGARRSMLETIMRCSRHRWTLLKLPARRMERRLSAAAQWFAEQLSRHKSGKIDVIFASEALNLVDFLKLAPRLAKTPAVVYFHDNQLPDASELAGGTHELVNLNSAQAAAEIWFNSEYHRQVFAGRAQRLVERHTELAGKWFVAEIMKRSRVMAPPIDLHLPAHVQRNLSVQRQRRTVFVDTRDGDARLLEAGLSMLAQGGEQFSTMAVGPIRDLTAAGVKAPIAVDAEDEVVQTAALLQSDIFLSVKRKALVDLQVVRAMATRCWPVVPDEGVYREIVPRQVQAHCLYDGSAQQMVGRIQDLWYLMPPEDADLVFTQATKPFDAIVASRAMDERLVELAGMFSAANKKGR